MIFGPAALEDCEGAILAHALSVGTLRLKKGAVLGRDDVLAAREAGLSELIVARLDPSDVPEDRAAERIAEALAGEHVGAAPAATGRANLYSGTNGLFRASRSLVDRINAVDPGITLATLADFTPAEAGRMVATVKIIPLAVPEASVAAVASLLREADAIWLAPYVPKRVSLVQTCLPATKKTVLDKTVRVSEARLAPSGSTLRAERRCAHQTAALAETLGELPESDLVLVFGASAVIDEDDVIPAAIRQAGGEIDHFGMPVDPGNLLLLGRIGETRVIGAPGCARSPKENGFDWVLNRLLADLEVSRECILAMGVGGLLMEMPTRPAPREGGRAK